MADQNQAHTSNYAILFLLKVAATFTIFFIGAAFAALPIFVEKFRYIFDLTTKGKLDSYVSLKRFFCWNIPFSGNSPHYPRFPRAV